MDLIYFLLIGLCAGWLAGHFTTGKGFGLVGNLIVGVIGAVVGGFLLAVLGFSSNGLLARLITATAGALVLLTVLRYATKGSGRRRR